MKKLLMALSAILLLNMTQAFAHSDHELGPNGGRILEFSKNQSIHGEVTLTNGMFHVAILDKDMKPMELKDQTLTVTGGPRNAPQKPKVEKQGQQFGFPELKGDNYLLVFQFKENTKAKPITARFEYYAAKCGTCKKGEWLCDCGLKAKAQKEKKDKEPAKK